MKLPAALIESLQGVAGFDEAAFIAVHESGEQVTSVRFNPQKFFPYSGDESQTPTAALPAGAASLPLATHHLPVSAPVLWSSQGYYLSTRPSFTFDPLFHAGAYYVQEASSMFLEHALRQTVDLSKPLRALDLCAAPGGKSTLLQSLISKDSLLVSNDVIKSRAAILEENITKWGAANVAVTNNDPIHFARLQNYFDVMVIDAPCSGSGLFRRDANAIDEWSENNVQLCCQRQQRIIADVWPALKQDGILIYSTCSYSAEEDEAVLNWLTETYNVQGMPLTVPAQWNIVTTLSANKEATGYRFFPDKVKGEGFFLAVLQKKEGGSFVYPKPGKTSIGKPTKTEEAIIQPWLQEEQGTMLFKQHDDFIAWPAVLEREIPVLQSALYIKKAGITVGKIAGSNLIPDHQLAMSSMVNKNIVRIAVTAAEAIQYLQKQDVQLATTQKGWALVNYMGYDLGWIKLLPNRFNNYYPKEWRIIKQTV